MQPRQNSKLVGVFRFAFFLGGGSGGGGGGGGGGCACRRRLRWSACASSSSSFDSNQKFSATESCVAADRIESTLCVQKIGMKSQSPSPSRTE